MRAAIYARVSTVGHGQDIGLQLDELRQVAAQRGWTIEFEYSDKGVSGAKNSRPALDQMMADAQAGRFDVLLIWKLDRLGRSLQHLLTVTSSLTEWGIDLTSVRDPGLDTTSASGRLLLQILACFSEFEHNLIRERVIAGVRRAQAAGKTLWSSPQGNRPAPRNSAPSRRTRAQRSCAHLGDPTRHAATSPEGGRALAVER